MQIAIQGFVNDRPKFQAENPIQGGSLIDENRQIKVLKPSAQYKNKLIRAIQRIFNNILSWLYPFERTNYPGIIAALDRSSARSQMSLSKMGTQETLAYFQRFLSADTASSPSLKKCVEQLASQYQMVEKYHQLPPLSNENREREKLGIAYKSWVDTVKTLKESEQSLILVNDTPGNELFYLFSKSSLGINLKITGRGDLMATLSGIQEIAVKGKAKIPSTLTYQNIDINLLTKLSSCSPLGEGGANLYSLPEIIGNLAPNRVEDTSSEKLASKTDNFAKLFWTTLKEANQNVGKSKGETIRLKLRYELFTLFSILKEYRDTLFTDMEQVHAVERMLRICSQDLLKAHQKGVVSKSELDQLAAELTEVKKALDVANTGHKEPFSKLTISDMSIYPSGTLTELTPPSAVSTLIPTRQMSTRTSAILPPSNGLHITRDLQQRVLTFDELTQDSPSLQIIKTLYATPFSPFVNQQDKMVLDTNNFWVNRSKPQAEELIQKLNRLSTRLVEDSLKSGELSMDTYEALLKMTNMVAFLIHHVINEDQLTDESYRNLFSVSQISHYYQFQWSYWFPQRLGYTVHSANAHMGFEFRNFSGGLSSTVRELNYVNHQNKKIITPSWAPLRSQFALFDRLMPGNGMHSFDQHYSGSYGLANYKGASLGGSLHEWMPSLEMRLLAVYHTMVIRDTTQGQVEKFRKVANRDTQEAAVDDPEGVANWFVDFVKRDEISQWREWAASELKASTDPQRKEQLKALLNKQAEYLLNAARIESDFSKEEFTALLLLLKRGESKTELIAFMEKHDAMLANLSVRNFIQMLLFSPSLSYIDDQGRQMLSTFLSKKLVEYAQKASNDMNEIPKLLFFTRLNERLKGVCKALGQNTTAFAEPIELAPYIEMLRTSGASLPTMCDAISLQLGSLLKKPTLSDTEICQILVDRQFLKGQERLLEGHERNEIETAYEQMLNELSRRDPSVLTQSHFNYILDAICTQKKLPLDTSSWARNGMCFENDKYHVDLVRGTVKEKVSGCISGSLPGVVSADPLFRKSFPDLLNGDMNAVIQQSGDGTLVYQFEDTHHHQCRIEEKNGMRRYYKSFPQSNHPGLLQAANFSLTNPSGDALASFLEGENRQPEPISGISGVFTMLKKLIGIQAKEPKLPALLKQTFFIDPQQPTKGYIASDKGEFQFEVEMEETRSGLRIRNVIDLRGGKRSEPQQLIHAGEIDHPLLSQLKQFEHPDHILLWGPTGSILTRLFSNRAVEKIDLPRYGISFALEGGEWVCQDPRYAGYRLSHSATLGERKGFAFSLLLEHPDRTRPKKLLIPPSSAIEAGNSIPPRHHGIAYYIWVVKTFLNLLFSSTFPSLSLSLHQEIESRSQSLALTAVDLHPHTGEVDYEKGKELDQGQELVGQALALGEFELADELVQSIEMERSEHSVREWMHFIRLLKTKNGASSIALKACDRLYETVRDGEGYKPFRKKIRATQERLFKAYLQEMGKFSAPLRLKKDLFDRLAALMKKKDPSYYLKHVAPFSRPLGDQFELYVRYTNGLETGVPQIEQIAQETRQPRVPKIEQLEALLHPDQPIPLEDLDQSFTVIKGGPCLVMPTDALARYFNNGKVITSSENELLRDIEEQRKHFEKKHQEIQGTIDGVLNSTSDTLDQLRLFAKDKKIATQSDLMVALVQNDFQALINEGRIHQGFDWKQQVTDLYDVEVKLHLMNRCHEELSRMIKAKNTMNAELWALKSSALYDLLTYRRQYSEKENPELLIFEALHFMTYRDSTEPSQLDHLNAIIGPSAGITQAGTGSGKSSVLTILRALMRSRGSSLVTQKVLPHLYSEMLALMETRFGKSFKRKIFPLRFDLTQPLHDRGGSIFKSIYHKILETIENRGCVLTDYKSFPVIEEKLWSLSLELFNWRKERLARNEAVNWDECPVDISHWPYLMKIITLLMNRDDQLMDEFDEPNRPVHRIQTQISAGVKPADFMINESLKLYDRLMRQPELLLEKNLQGDVSVETRLGCIKRVAEEIAREKARDNITWEEIAQYLLGHSEAVLAKVGGWNPEEKDALALQKDQFTIYLKLTLANSGITKYKKSKDGKKILTCLNGDPREAKFGNILEEINYSIQEYLQHKVAKPTFHSWVTDQLKDFRAQILGTEQRFTDLIPGASLQNLDRLSSEELKKWVDQQLPLLNQRPEFVRFFLERHLNALKTGGMVATMNPQNIVDMSRTVSGVSATVGSLGALHKQFKTNKEAADRLKHEMTERLRRRTVGAPLRYDPANPLAAFNLLTQQKIAIDVVIDGAGAFRESDPKIVAEAMLRASGHLKKVEYYQEDGTIGYVGEQGTAAEAIGFYFPQAFTTGSDRQFKPDAVAFLTVSEPGTMEDLNQQEGRMRLPSHFLPYV